MQFLSTLPAILGLAGFVVYFFLSRNRGGDQITLDIVAKLRRDVPGHLPPDAERFDPGMLARLIEGDAALRTKVSGQDFQLLRDALRQQFVTSITVYGLCAVVFLAGIALYVYTQLRPKPVSISSISAASVDPQAQGLPVDLDGLLVRWSAAGDPEDIKVSLEEMDHQRRTAAKTVRSTDGEITFAPEEIHDILTNRDHNGENKLRVTVQTSASSYFSSIFSIHVGTTILAVHIEPLRIKIMGVIDNEAIQNYTFDARLLVWATGPHQQSAPRTYPAVGTTIPFGSNDFELDPDLTYDWSTVKLVYFGPDDPRTVRTQLLGF
jgi:hypothetical protein